jgi:hypothetical protein|tara:strand:+ start:68 stop:247 length:180 start_codon:yes stop_codon:yes gene_type:complete
MTTQEAIEITERAIEETKVRVMDLKRILAKAEEAEKDLKMEQGFLKLNRRLLRDLKKQG